MQNKKAQHRPASQDVAHQHMHQHEQVDQRQLLYLNDRSNVVCDVGYNCASRTMTNNLMPINQPVVYNFNPQNTAQASQQNNNRRNLDRKQQYAGGASGEGQGSNRNSQHTGVRGVGKLGGGPQQMAHSMTRDIDAMGLLTQVKKGDDMRNQKKNPRQGQSNSGQQQANSQQTKYSARQHAPKQNLNMASQQLTQQNMYFLLKPQTEAMRGRKTLLLDVDETLVHSTFTQTDKADIVLPIDIEGRACNIFVQVRPGCQEFIKEVGKHFEVAIFTASLSKYANPLMDILDPERVAPQRLFREHCTFYNEQFVKDMQRVGRRMEDIMILDNSPNCYRFQQENGLPIISWYDDPEDVELMNYLPALRLLSQVDDVRPVILQSVVDNEWNLDLSMKICQSLLILKQQKEQEELEEQQQKQRELDTLQRQAAFIDQTSSGRTRKSGAGSFLNSEQNNKTSEQRTPEIDSIKRNHDRSEGGYNQTSSWLNRNNDQVHQQSNLSAKKEHFSNSGKKSQPSQARSFQKNSIVKDASESGIASTSQRNSQIVQQYEAGQQQQQQHSSQQQQILQQQSRLNSQQPLQPIVDHNQDTSSHSKIMTQPGPKISNNTVPIHTMPSKQQKIRNAANSTSQYDEQQSATTGTNATSSRLASKKVMSETKPNGMKLSEYLVKQDQENLGESQPLPAAQFKRVSSRNKNTEAALSGSHRNIHTLSHLLIKPQNNFNVKSGINDQSISNSNVNSQHVSYQTPNYSKTISALKPNSTLVNSNNRNGSAADGVRATNGIRNGSKRRANSNTVQEKKVNLDKFLSVVQSRYNYTNTGHASSVNQLSNTRNTAPKSLPHHISKPTDEKMSKVYQQQHSGSTTNAQNQQPISHHSTKNGNLERKKVGQMRVQQFNSNSELPYSQQSQHASKKIHNLKVASSDHHRESANKTTGARGVQLNQNNIIFSKNMNLSQILQEKTKNNLIQSSTGKQQTSSTSDVKKNSQETQQQLGGTQRNLIANTVSHKSQKSTSNLQHTQQLQSTGASGLSQLSSPQLHSSKALSNPYSSATKTSSGSGGIQGLIQGGNSRNSSVKYASSKLNGSQGSLRHQQPGSSSLTLKRMSAGGNNLDGGKHIQQPNTAAATATVPLSLNSRGGSRKIKASNTNANTTAKKYTAQSQLFNNVENQQRQSLHQKSLIDENSSSQLFIRMSGSQNKSQQVQQHNQAATVKHKSQTRSSANQQDYNRSPGRIFNANVQKSGASQQASLTHHSGSQPNNKISSTGKSNNEFASITSAGSKVAGTGHVHQQSNNQLINKRSSKPQLMSELNMTLKNKKINQITATNKASEGGGYHSFRKPLVSAGRSPPQTTKNGGVVATQIDNFTGHSYTQRVVAANVQNQGRNRQGNMYQGRQHPIDQPRTQAAAMPDSVDLSQSASIVTPRKKILKLVSASTQGNSGQQMQFNTAASLPQQTGSAATNANFTDAQSKNSKKAGALKNNSAKLLTNFYQQHHRQIKEGSLDVGSMSSQQQPQLEKNHAY